MTELREQQELERKKQNETKKAAIWLRPPVIVIGTVVVSVLFFFGLAHLLQSYTHESTDNAFLDGHIVAVAPKVAGQIKQVLVAENQAVKAGDPIVEIDPEDLQIQVDQKKAAFDAAQANVKLLKASFDYIRAQVQTAQAKTRQAQAEVAAKQAAADRAAADLKRGEELKQGNIISPQEFDAFKAAADSASASLVAAQQNALSEQSKVTEVNAQLEAAKSALERGEAQVKQSDVDRAAASLNLSYTHIVAPQDGRVTRKAVEKGEYVQIGQRIMAIVPSNVWVTANFKETQLTHIRPGQPVEIAIDSVADNVYHGHIESIQSGTGARFSLLPPENAVGSYVKVVQRVPVRIFFDSPLTASHVIGPGMSVVPIVQIRDLSVSAILMALVAVVLAAILGMVWWRAASRHARLAVVKLA